jgi:hypothetical protein
MFHIKLRTIVTQQNCVMRRLAQAEFPGGQLALSLHLGLKNFLPLLPVSTPSFAHKL